MKTRESKSSSTKTISKKLYIQLDDLIYHNIDENGRHMAQEPMPKPYDAIYVANVLAVEYKSKKSLTLRR